jgi:hypothetical protein
VCVERILSFLPFFFFIFFCVCLSRFTGCSVESVKGELMPLFTSLVNDEQDSVRLLAVEAILQFGRHLSTEDSIALLVGPLHEASKDRRLAKKKKTFNKK